YLRARVPGGRLGGGLRHRRRRDALAGPFTAARNREEEDVTLSRRTLLAGIAALPALGAEKEPQVPRRKLGKTGREIPILLMGTAMRLDPRFDPKLAEGLRFGVNYFDTADCYGSESPIGSFLERTRARPDLWITTKSDRWDPDGMRGNLATSLERLKTDH